MSRQHQWVAGGAAAAAALLVLSVPVHADASRKNPRPKPTPTPSPAPTSTASPAPTSAPKPVALAPGSVSPSTIAGGDGAVQTIRLTAPAPAGGVDVWITASDGMYTASAGSSVHVPAGATSVSFPFRLTPPSTDVVRSLWAQISGSPLTEVATVAVRAADPATRAVASLAFDPGATVVGTTTTGTVTLTNPAPQGGLAVSLWSNTSYGDHVQVPKYVLVEAGNRTATFPAYVTSVSSPSVVSPSADLGTSIASGKLIVVPQTFALGGAVLWPGNAGEVAIGIGTAPNPTGTTIALASDTPGVAVPHTVTIPAGSSGVTFPVTVAGSLPPGGSAQLTATWNGVSVTSTVHFG